MQGHPNSVRPKHGALARREYVLLASEDPAGNPVAAEGQGIGHNPGDTTGIGETNEMDTGTEERNR